VKTRAVLIAALALAFASLASTSLASHRSTASTLSPQTVLDWNTHAWTVVSQAMHPREVTPPLTRNLFQVEGLLYMTYTQAAVYDAVVAIEGRYEPYGFSLLAPNGASPDAAVAQAAHDVLSYYLASWLTFAQVTQLDTWLSDSLAAIPDGQSKTDGISVGHAAALGIIAIRTNDGRDGAEGTFGTGPIAAGAWVLTPGPFTFAQTPWIGTMRPFMLRSTSQFRPPPPPPLNSSKYAQDLNEVKAYGSLTSTVRTDDQKKTAFFWNANGPNQYNDAFRGVITQHDLDLVDAARLLAMGDMAIEDAGMACFEAKYSYLFWRPITAIQHADIDGNPKTHADPSWTPLLTNPNHPEYPSAHGCVTSAFTEVLKEALHTTHIDLFIKGAENGATSLTTTRHFDTTKEVTGEIEDARVWIGFHFRNSVKVGLELGKKVAQYGLVRNFRPARDH
jgi:hypothetical protein